MQASKPFLFPNVHICRHAVQSGRSDAVCAIHHSCRWPWGSLNRAGWFSLEKPYRSPLLHAKSFNSANRQKNSGKATLNWGSSTDWFMSSLCFCSGRSWCKLPLCKVSTRSFQSIKRKSAAEEGKKWRKKGNYFNWEDFTCPNWR